MDAEEYLSHRYFMPQEWPLLPLPDEPFLARWEEVRGEAVLHFLAKRFSLPVTHFAWEDAAALSLAFADTLAGHLPVLMARSLADFRNLAAILQGKTHLPTLPSSVHAFAMRPKMPTLAGHFVLLLHHAPYSGVFAAHMGLRASVWLQMSQTLRLRHECAHYETLRLFGGMKNHALDEILADLLGQIAAFGSFDADRQRRFFGLEQGKKGSAGRLSFYCRRLGEDARAVICEAVDSALDSIAEEVRGMQENPTDTRRIFERVATVSLWERWMLHRKK